MSKQIIRPVRSALFVPGDRPERFSKALASGADKVIVDFEDAVDESQKEEARENLKVFLTDNPNAEVVVRINSAAHPEHEADLAFCASLPQVEAVLLPKAESREQVDRVGQTGKPVWALIESAAGLERLTDIAQGVNVERLTYGALDLGVDLCLIATSAAAQRMYDQVRFAMVLASTRYKLAAPLETVFPDISNTPELKTFARNALEMGMEGMLCIHPSQVSTANDAFSPSLEEIEWASKVISAAKDSPGAFRLEGKMVDAPVIAYAKKVLSHLNIAS